MSGKIEAERAAGKTAEAGSAGFPLCREPWQNFYILRRGVLPCCYGGTVIGQMADYAAAWNSAEMQEIRRYLSRGELSPYCLLSPGCPIVQRVQAQKAARLESRAGNPPGRKGALGALRRFFLGAPDAGRRIRKKR